MKINYRPSGTSKSAPKQWEIWLADAQFGSSEKKRCPVLVAKRTPNGYEVLEIIPVSAMGGKDVRITDLERAGQNRPAAVRTSAAATIPANMFVQKLGTLLESDVTKVITARKRVFESG